METDYRALPRAREKSIASTLVKYTAGKIFTLFLMVTVSVLLIILIGNFGGYIDEMVKGEVSFAVGMQYRALYLDLPFAERAELINRALERAFDAAGLNEPFINRTLRWLWMAIRLDLGHPMEGSPFFPTLDTNITVRQMLANSFPPTLALFGTVNFVVFFSSLGIGLVSSQKYGSRLDRFIQKATVLSTIPPWFYGVIIGGILITNQIFLPNWLLLFVVLFIGSFFQSAFSWRTYFLLFEGEDYVEYAKSQGLPNGLLRRKAIIRPSMPTVLTNFSLSMISAWMGSIILEVIFGWPGIGQLFYYASFYHDTSILIGVVVVYAYVLAFTIFILDIAYFFADPRIRVSQRNTSLRPKRSSRRFSPKKVAAVPSPQKKNEFNLRELWLSILSPVQVGLNDLRRAGLQAWQAVKELAKERRMKWSLITISLLFLIAIITMIVIPYHKAIELWRGDGNIFIYYPRYAQPAWTNWFREDKLPPSIILNTEEGGVEKIVEVTSETNKVITIYFTFDYPYSDIPEDINLYVDAEFDKKQPLYMLYWETPDGERTKLADFTNSPEFRYTLSTSEEIQRKLGSEDVEEALFMNSAEPGKVQQGTYSLVMETFFFEPDSDLDVEFIMRGKVYGLAGTDDQRRNIMVVLLWGLPIVLAFGLFGAILTNILTMVIAAVSSWYGGWLDTLISRITEINMALPAFPISLMIFSMYSKSIFVILAVTVALNIFGQGVKTYRSAFLQIKESQYIESAIAYGAKDRRLIFRYMVPRIISILVPQIIVAVPSFVFLETALAFLGMSDPVFPTWGKLFVRNLFLVRGTTFSFSPENMPPNTYVNIILPAVMLIILTLSFNTLGKGLEKVLNPRLRDT